MDLTGSWINTCLLLRSNCTAVSNYLEGSFEDSSDDYEYDQAVQIPFMLVPKQRLAQDCHVS